MVTKIESLKGFRRLSTEVVLAIRWSDCVADGEMVTKSERQPKGDDRMVVNDVGYTPIELPVTMFREGGYFEVISRPR